MEPENQPPENRKSIAGPLMVFIVAGIIVAANALVLILHPNPAS